MPKNADSLNRSLFELIQSKGYDPTMLSTSGKEIPTPEEAEVFQFNFIKDGEDYGKVTMSIDGSHKLVIYFNDEVANSEKEDSESGDLSWYQLLNQLKRFAQKYQLSFELRNVSNLKHDMAKREYMKKKESIAEGYYPMGKKASYSDAVPSVKIVLQHTRQIEEGEQRYRNVAKIFLENEHGERFLAPTTKPGIARVYARHLAEGGLANDERWNHIKSLCEEYQKMAGFVRATRSGQFNESTQKLIAEGINHYQSLRESLGKLAGHRGYNAYFESWTPTLMEDDSDTSTLNELFVQETVDPRIESVMPILARLSKNISEMNEVNELAEWADKLVEGDEDIEDNEVEDAADNAEQELTEAPGAETLKHNQNTEKSNLKAFELDEGMTKDAMMNDAEKMSLEQFVEKYGDEDWIKEFYHTAVGTEDVEEGFIDTVKKVGGKVLDKLGHGSDDELLRDLQKKAGIPSHAQHAKPRMAVPNDELKETPDTQFHEGDMAEALDPMKKQRLQDLIDQYTDATDPEYMGDDDSEDIIAQIRAEFGDRTADSVADGPSMHFPRPGHVMGHDDLEFKQMRKNLSPNRITKVGKLHKQDSDAMKRDIKSRYGQQGVAEGSEEGNLYAIAIQRYPQLKQVDRETVINALNNAYEDYLMHYGYEGIGPDEESSMIDYAVKGLKQGVAEDLDANQKRVGQLGPYEKVGPKGAVGKLVGNESLESTEESITEMDTQTSGDPYEKGSKATPIKADKAKKDFSKILQKSVDKHNKAKQDTDKKVAQHQVKESIQLDEGVMDSIKGIVGKIKAIPGIQKFIQAAQAKKAELIQAAQQSRNGQELVKNIQAIMGGQQAVAEGWGQKLSGGLVASAGGGLMATGAEMFMRAWNAMGKPDLAQMMTDPGRDGQIVLALVTMLVLVGALSLFGGGHMFKQGLEKDAQPMREGQEDLEAILRIIRK